MPFSPIDNISKRNINPDISCRFRRSAGANGRGWEAASRRQRSVVSGQWLVY